MTTRAFKPLNIFLLFLIILMQFALWFGDKNVFDLYRLHQSDQHVAQLNQRLFARNQQLLAEVIDLKQGGETLETIARSELGLIKEGETFYQIIE